MHAGQSALQRGQLMVVRGEHGALRQASSCPRSIPALARAIAMPSIGARCRGRSRPRISRLLLRRVAAECSRHLAHLQHEGGLARTQGRRDAPMRVNTRSTMPMSRAVRRNEGADLRHQRDERGLAHIGALARHVRPGDDGDAVSRRAVQDARRSEQRLSR